MNRFLFLFVATIGCTMFADGKHSIRQARWNRAQSFSDVEASLSEGCAWGAQVAEKRRFREPLKNQTPRVRFGSRRDTTSITP